jgi:crotonobetainyl-CoA:carnitine CoA-transferase CaiB-like acyl-CoA transferase
MTDQVALAGLRVVDLSTRLSGAYCAKLFGDCGADVVLLEERDGHPLRAAAPFLDDRPGPDRSLLHAYANANKRSVCLERSDPRRPRLIALADVVLVSTRAAAAEVADLAGERTILVGVSPYGLDTELADAPGTDLTAYAATGWALANGHEGAPPLQGVHHQPSYLAGVMAYVGAVAALIARDRGGDGQVVDVCELEPLAWMAAPAILAASHGEPKGRRTPGVFGGPVAARDGAIALTFSRPHFWSEAMKSLGLDDLAEDPRYKTSLNRREHTAELAPAIEERVATRGRWELFEAISRPGGTAGVVLDMADLAASEHLRARGVFAETEIDGRAVETLASPARMSATPWRLRRRAPRLGEHTDEVLAEWLTAAVEVGA